MSSTAITNATTDLKPEYTTQYSYTTNDRPYYIITTTTGNNTTIDPTDPYWGNYENYDQKQLTAPSIQGQWVIPPGTFYPPEYYPNTPAWPYPDQYLPPGFKPENPNDNPWMDPAYLEALQKSFGIKGIKNDPVAPNIPKEEKKELPKPIIDKGRSFDMDDDFDL